MKHLLKMMDLSTEEIIEILNLADQLKYELKHGIPHDHLKGKTLGMIFRKASTRTRVSFETEISAVIPEKVLYPIFVTLSGSIRGFILLSTPHSSNV
jgi:aspartate carbamoyltransferase catalytic subunit